MTMEFYKFAENITILNNHCPGILKGLYHVKKALCDDSANPTTLPLIPDVPIVLNKQRTRPKILCTEQIQPLLKVLVKKFPEAGIDGTGTMGKTSGYELFVNSAKLFSEDLKPIYDVFALVVDFVGNALAVLQQVNQLVGLSYELTPDLTIAILDLLVNLFFVVDTVSRLPQEKKAVVSAYSLLHYIQTGHAEPRYSRISRLITQYEKHIPVLQDQLSPLTKRILELIPFLKRDVESRLLMTATTLKLSKLLVVMSDISGGMNVESNDSTLKVFQHLDRRFAYLVVAFLLFPIPFSKTSLMDTLCSALSYGYLLPVYGDISISISDSCESALKPHSKTSDIKRTLKEALSHSQEYAPTFHKQRRDFFTLLLRQLVAYCDDKDAFNSRLLVFVATLSLAQCEVVWYFTHFDRGLDGEIMKDREKGKWVVDNGIFELLTAIVGLETKMNKTFHVLQSSTVSFIGQNSPPVLEFFKNLRQSIHSDQLSVLIDNIYLTLSKFALAPAENDVQLDLGTQELLALRMNWLRLQFWLVNAQLPQIVSLQSAPLMEKMSILCDRTTYLEPHTNSDTLMNNLGEGKKRKLCPLDFLFYHLTQLTAHLSTYIITSPQNLKHLGVVGDILEEFMDLPSEYWDEFRGVASQSVMFAEGFYESLGRLAARACHEYATGLAAMSPVTSKLSKAGNNLRKLSSLKLSAKNLLYAINYKQTVAIYDSQFHPREFFLDALKRTIETHISSAAFDQNSITDDRIVAEDAHLLEVKRPSLFCAEMKSYLFGLQSVSEWGDFDLGVLFEQMILEQINPMSAKDFAKDLQNEFQLRRPPSPRTRAKQPRRTHPKAQPFSVTYALWFIDMINTKVTNGSVIYSHSERRFVSKAGLSVQVSEWLEFSEIWAMCDIMGPNGIVFIDMKITELVCQLVASVKEIVIQNMATIGQLRSNWSSDGWRQIRAISGMNDFKQKMVLLGFIHHLRTMLFKTLSQVYQRKAPHVFSFIQTIHQRYEPNTLEKDEFKSYDFLANSIGLIHRADTSMQESLKSVYGNPALDQTIWKSLPVLFASAALLMCYDDWVVYDVQMDSLSNNGHCLAAAFNLITTNALPHGTPPSDITALQKEFVSSLMTMCWKMQDKRLTGEEMRNPNAVWVIIKHFTELTSFLCGPELEEVLPHALLTTTMSNIVSSSLAANLEYSPKKSQHDGFTTDGSFMQ